MRKLLSLAVLILSLSVAAQEGASTPYTLGIKTGVNLSTLLGTEFQNARPRFGYTGGVYLRYPMRGVWSMQTEVLANFRGSRFANPAGNYRDLDLFTIDVPILVGYDLEKDKKQLLAGLQPSTILLSAVFLDPKGKVHKTDLDFNPVLLDAVLAYQVKSGVAGYQMALKGSLLDMNNDIYLEGVEPSTAHDGSIYNLSFELSLIF